MIKNDREALNLLKTDYAKNGQVDINNAIVRRLQHIGQKGTGEQFMKRAKKFMDKVSKQQRYRDYEKSFYNFIGKKFKKAIDNNKRNLITSRLQLFIDSFDKEYKGKLSAKQQDIYDKNKDAIHKASDADGTKLATRRTTGEKQPKAMKQTTQVHKKTIPPRWKIDFKALSDKEIPGGEAELNAKELFQDMLDGKSGTILKKGMNETDEQKLQVAVIQQRLGVEIDGDFGPVTKEAVEKFQEDNNLEKDGRVGRQTISQMFSKTSKGIASNVPITGKDIDPVMKDVVEKMASDNTNTYITGKTVTLNNAQRDINLDDKKQRGLEEQRLLRVDDQSMRALIREMLINSL